MLLEVAKRCEGHLSSNIFVDYVYADVEMCL